MPETLSSTPVGPSLELRILMDLTHVPRGARKLGKTTHAPKPEIISPGSLGTLRSDRRQRGGGEGGERSSEKLRDPEGN